MLNLRSKKSIRYFTDQELKRLFCTMEKELKESICEMEEKVEGSKERKWATNNYKWTVRDVAFFKLLYLGAFKVSDLTLPLESFDPNRNEIRCKKSKNGIYVTLMLDKEVLKLLKLHLKVNKPKKFLFENVEGKPFSREVVNIKMGEEKTFSRKLVEWRFAQYCELAEIENEDKWQWQTLRYTKIKNYIRKTA